MRVRLKRVAVAFLVILVVAQLIRPNRTNPPIVAGHGIQASAGTSSAIGDVLDRGCGQCHSNATTWPWYTNIAPVSWLMASGVSQGRKAVNFSEWAAYPAERQQALLAASCRAASSGKMPGSLYTTLYPETRLSTQDVATICEAAHSSPNR